MATHTHRVAGADLAPQAPSASHGLSGHDRGGATEPGGHEGDAPHHRAIRNANAEALRILGLSFDELTNKYTVDFEPETIFEDGSPCTNAEYPVTKATADDLSEEVRAILDDTTFQ